jgi:penicillin-binding protein 1A
MIRKVLIIGGLCIGILCLGLLFLYLFVVSGLSGQLPSKKYLSEIQRPQASSILANDGTVLGLLYTENRSAIQLTNCPLYLTEALIATEDVRFFNHHGIDYRSLGRVLIKGILSSSSAGGGSTLSQQLAKNLFPRQNYWLLATPINKIREITVARRIERIYSKEEILEQYLNTVSFGELTFGISTASKRFFNKNPDALLLEEAATLVGILKAPTYYSPRRFPERARGRRNIVLAQMAKYNKISQDVCDSISALSLTLSYTPDHRPSELSGYLIAHIERQARAILDEIEPSAKGEMPDVRVGGLKIYTSIDPVIQAHAETAVRRQMPRIQARFDKDWGKSSGDWETQSWIDSELKSLPQYQSLSRNGLSHTEIIESFSRPAQVSVFSWSEADRIRSMSVIDSLKYYKQLLQTGFFAMDPSSGMIKAWVGGIDHRFFQYDHVLSRRQAGSTFKPIVYAAAFEAGIPTCQYYDNARVVFADYDEWSPRNANRLYSGCYSIQGGLVHSINTVAAQVLKEVGVSETIGMARRLGIQSEIPSVPSIALGSAELRLDELTAAYGVFANAGYYREPVCILKIEDRQGNLVYAHQPSIESIRVLSDSVALEMLHTLQMVVDSGTAQGLRSVFGLDVPLAGKTGTTQRYADGWFIGISPGLVTGVWVGADDPRVHFRTGAGAGGQTALLLYGDFMRSCLADSRVEILKMGLNNLYAQGYSPSCPLYSDLNAGEMMALLEAQKDRDSWFLPNLLESLFAKKGDDPRQVEQRILRQMQEKLDKTAIRMQKRKKSPTSINRALEEVRKDYYRRLEEERSRIRDN